MVKQVEANGKILNRQDQGLYDGYSGKTADGAKNGKQEGNQGRDS